MPYQSTNQFNISENIHRLLNLKKTSYSKLELYCKTLTSRTRFSFQFQKPDSFVASRFKLDNTLFDVQ